jgi:transglutaminase-like putative cysteine protease
MSSTNRVNQRQIAAMPILSIRHLTRYRYRSPVSLGEHRMMFRPRESYDQRLLSHNLTITPHPAKLRFVHDLFGNCVGVAEFAGRTRELTFQSSARLEHTPLPAFAGLDDEIDVHGGAASHYSPEDLPDLRQSLERLDADPRVDLWARRFVRPFGSTRLQTLLCDMTQAIHAGFQYRTRLDSGPQTPAQTLALGSGSCRDFAVLMIDAARSLGLAARFVSGYIHSPSSGSGGPGRVGGGHTHAWVRVYLPASGWAEFDPTNGIVGNADLVRVAIVREPRQAVPLHGTWSGQPEDYLGMDVEVEVRAECESAAQPSPLRAVGMAG